MKKRNKMNLAKASLLVLISTFTFMACSSEEPLSVTDEAFLLLEGSWGLGSIQLDGVDQSANYPGFELTFTSTGYSASSGGSLFTSGSWEWMDDNASVISLIDGKDLNLITLTEKDLVFTFTLNDGGAASGISGNYRIALVKL